MLIGKYYFSLMQNKKIYQYLLYGIWILNCVLGSFIAIREIWIPNMSATPSEYSDIISDPFDGTTLPIRYIPDWTQKKYQDKTLVFSDIPTSDLIPLPPYDPAELLKENTTKALTILKYTYTVPYMGSYNLNYKEYDGSHLGIDIRAVIGTPVLSIANGVVVKTVEADPTGNKYIVVRHDHVPLNGEITTLYSAYLHLSSINIAEGTKVKKGEMIGRVGVTGITTAPHLHLQIDRDTAPFHPYWPYTMQDARNAGLTFLAAVTAGLGKDNAAKYTIHPLAYVQAHADGKNESITLTAPRTTTSPGVPALLNPKLEDVVKYNTTENIKKVEEELNPKLEDIVKTNPSESVIVAAQMQLNTTESAPLSRRDALLMLMQFYNMAPREGTSHLMDVSLSDELFQGYALLAEEKNIIR